MAEPEGSGKDLARLALANWKATAKKTAATGVTKTWKKHKRAQYGDARDPVGLGEVITRLGEENEWRTGVQGGSLTDRWAELCPELVGKVAPAGYDPATGRLDLRPASPAYAANLRILGPQLVTRLQAKGAPVRAIRVLAPGALPNEASAAPTSQPATDRPAPAPAPPPAGYTAAIEAHLKASPKRRDTEIQQRIKAAADAQTEAIRANREAPEAHRDAVWFVNDLEEKATAEREQTRQAAIRRAREQKAGRAPELRTAFQQTA